jgi:hypothetical protein
MHIGLFGNNPDDHIVAIAEKLRARGATVVVLGSDSPVLFRCERQGQTIHVACDDVPLEEFRSFFYFPKFSVPRFGNSELWAEEYVVQNEWMSVVANLSLLFEEKTLNSPVASYRFSKKLPQLALAESVGLATPVSRVTNDASFLSELVSSPAGAILKPLGNPVIPTIFIEDGVKVSKQDSLMTTDVPGNAEDLAGWIRSCPHYFQEKVSKDHELRVIGVRSARGSDFFAFRIDSQSEEHAATDWRLSATFTPSNFVEIDTALQSKLAEYLRLAGLSFGSFDLIVQPDGVIVFLECNPEGTWRWLDLVCSDAISEAFADALVAGKQ